ncbi:MAG: hypothetical protein V7L01_14730 [Nostoc sp.]
MTIANSHQKTLFKPNKWLRKIIYVIANEEKQSQNLAIASFRFSTRRYRERYTRNDNIYLILHYDLSAQ